MSLARDVLKVVESEMDNWIDQKVQDLKVSSEDEEEVRNVLSSIWQGMKTIYVRGGAKKYLKALMKIDDEEGSKGNASFVS